MAEITASMVKELREKTGAGMMECKKALAETNGNMEQAVDELRKRGQALANKASARAAKEGLIFCKIDGKVGTLLELNCVTDFVARNDDFRALGAELVAMAFAGIDGDKVEGLLDAVHPAAGKPVREVLTEAMAKTGENISVSRFVRVDSGVGEGIGFIQSYIHPPGKLGVLVQLCVGKAETLANETFKQLAADLAMQVAAAFPQGLDRASIPQATIDRERAIYAESDDVKKKPENIREKIIDGKMGKFYKESCLIEQVFVKNPDQTIEQVVAEVAKAVGDTIKVVGFVRYAVGGAAEKTESAE